MEITNNLSMEDYTRAVAQNADNAAWLGNIIGQRFCLALSFCGSSKCPDCFDVDLDAAHDTDSYELVSSGKTLVRDMPREFARKLTDPQRSQEYGKDGATVDEDTTVNHYTVMVNGQEVYLFAPVCWC